LEIENMAPVQSTYSETMQAPSPGTISSSDYDTITGIVETAAGIGFGLAVSVGTVATKGDKATILGGTADKFKGVSIRDIAALRPADNSDKYRETANIGIVRRGTVWVSPAVDVVADDPVHFDGATGVFSNTGGIGPIKGARWVTSAAANGRAEIYLPGLANAADV
jgi:hypothetical protein